MIKKNSLMMIAVSSLVSVSMVSLSNPPGGPSFYDRFFGQSAPLECNHHHYHDTCHLASQSFDIDQARRDAYRKQGVLLIKKTQEEIEANWRSYDELKKLVNRLNKIDPQSNPEEYRKIVEALVLKGNILAHSAMAELNREKDFHSLTIN